MSLTFLSFYANCSANFCKEFYNDLTSSFFLFRKESFSLFLLNCISSSLSSLITSSLSLSIYCSLGSRPLRISAVLKVNTFFVVSSSSITLFNFPIYLSFSFIISLSSLIFYCNAFIEVSSSLIFEVEF